MSRIRCKSSAVPPHRLTTVGKSDCCTSHSSAKRNCRHTVLMYAASSFDRAETGGTPRSPSLLDEDTFNAVPGEFVSRARTRSISRSLASMISLARFRHASNSSRSRSSADFDVSAVSSAVLSAEIAVLHSVCNLRFSATMKSTLLAVV